jgi:hypothetical protein
VVTSTTAPVVTRTTAPVLTSTTAPVATSTTAPTVQTTNAPTKSSSIAPSYVSTIASTAGNTIIDPSVDIQYYGGPVMIGTPNIYNIFFGDFSSTTSLQTTVSLVDYFAANLGGSSWNNIQTSYYQTVNGAKTYISNSLNFVKSINVSPNAQGLTVLDYDFQNIIITAINNGQLPIDTNGIYAIIYRGDFNVLGWLTSWCGYHTYFRLSTGELLKYFIVGDPATAPGYTGQSCEGFIYGPTANGNLGADSLLNVYAHEVVEMVSDPIFDAWYFTSGAENADVCNYDFGLYSGNSNTIVGNKPFLIQRNWLIGYGCRMLK